ncbi:MAG: tRNA lysidine(34) synthetase TilS [Parcubacteria group bacterium]|jgi:tRNA(Ile)-lysidine synthase
MKSLVKKVQNTIFQHKIFERGSKIILAVSGGPDSTCILDIFSKLQKKYDLELIIAHVNYGLRGKDSDKDEKFVRDLAKKYGLKIKILKPGFRKTPSEKELRDIRYDFFEKVRSENNFDLIAVAHNQDDQVETYLMRIIRGAGLQGLSAMQYKNEKVIRPLLNIPRAEIEKYLKENKLKYRIDKTNLESKYLRNKIRNKLIPYLEKNFNPQIKKTIFSSIETIAEDLEYISQVSDRAYAKNKELSVKKILDLPPAIQKRVILRAISDKKSGLKDIESAHIKELIKIIASNKNKRQVVLFKGLKVTRQGDKLKIELIK